jgi:hypothetical protein
MIKVIILTSKDYYTDSVTCLMITIYSHIQMKLVDKVSTIWNNLSIEDITCKKL